MTTVTVQVAATEAPAQGKKRGRIKDVSGTLYQALPSFLNMVKIGQAYELTYKDEEFNGRSYRVVEGITPAVGPSMGAPSAHTPARPGMMSQPQHQDDRGDDIATLAIAKVWLEKVPVGDEAGGLHALRAARRMWKKFKANPDNIETGRQPLENERWEEFPEQ